MGDNVRKKLNFIFSVIIFLLFITGCETNLMNTPTKRVETMLNNYITLNSVVLKDLDETLLKESTMTDNQKEEYRNIIKKLYQNMSYEIKKETIDGDMATIEVQIEVYDYKKTINLVNDYLESHNDEFKNDDNSIDILKFNDYKLSELKKTKDKVTYTIDFTLNKINDKWVLDDLTDAQISKLHGMYEN